MNKICLGIVLTVVAASTATSTMDSARLPPGDPRPQFHHLHLNATMPSAAIDYYARAFASVHKTKVGGFEGFTTTSRLSSRPGNVLVLFNRIGERPVPAAPSQSAIAHFGWNVPDSRGYLKKFRDLKLQLVPLYADPAGTIVPISSDALPGYLTPKQIADGKAKGLTPARGGGFLYVQGPDGALIESYGDFPEERFTHIHMFHKHPICAQQWYARHLGATVAATHLHLGPGRATDVRTVAETDDDCRRPFAEATYPAFDKEGRIREPSGYVLFDDIGLPIWPYPGTLVSTRGQTVDHIAVSVLDLKATVARLKREGITVLDDIHAWSDTRAALIEGPDLVAIELIQAR